MKIYVILREINNEFVSACKDKEMAVIEVAQRNELSEKDALENMCSPDFVYCKEVELFDN